MSFNIFEKKKVKNQKKFLKDRLLSKNLMQVKFSLINTEGFITSSIMLDVNKRIERDLILDECIRKIGINPIPSGTWRVLIVYLDSDGVHRKHYNMNQVQEIVNRRSLTV